MKELIKIRAEINEKEMKEIIVRLIKLKAGSLTRYGNLKNHE